MTQSAAAGTRFQVLGFRVVESNPFELNTTGDPVGDVALPPWAADAADCVAQLAAALESPHVSARLHLWIDLVFGCASRGAPAERADNVFHYLTYDDMCAGLGLGPGVARI